MKYRLIASALVIAVIGALVAAFDTDTPRPQAAPSPSADDKAFKSLSIN